MRPTEKRPGIKLEAPDYYLIAVLLLFFGYVFYVHLDNISFAAVLSVLTTLVINVFKALIIIKLHVVKIRGLMKSAESIPEAMRKKRFEKAIKELGRKRHN